jgi:tetraacyldisaccharide 4'-kinase
MVLTEVRPIKSAKAQSKTQLARQPIAAFCAVGNPEAFFNLVRQDFELTDTNAFRDHRQYTQDDIDRATREAIASGAHALVTTAKDEVKLRGLRFDLPCYVLGIEIEIDSADRLFELIDGALLTKSDK